MELNISDNKYKGMLIVLGISRITSEKLQTITGDIY